MTPLRTAWARRPTTAAVALLTAAGVAVVDFATLIPGWWWATALVALLLAFLLRGYTILLALLAGALLAWTATLLWRGSGHLRAVADLVGSLATGASGNGWLAFAATYATVLLLVLAGAWCGAATRRLVLPLVLPPAAEPSTPAADEAPTPTEAPTKEEEHV